ncbi:MAG: hypothetical protein ACU0CO_15730 [Shimia sp.]
MPLHVSVTGLRLHGPLAAPRFWWHATRSMAQARRAAGNLFADARTVRGVHHTLTVWRTSEDMRAYLAAGAHLAAMRAFRSLGTGRVLGFAAEAPPGWDDALARWARDARIV